MAFTRRRPALCRRNACRSIDGPCARLGSTTPTGAASTTPRASGARPRAAIDWTCRPSACSTTRRRAVLPLVPGGELNTCHNALDRHVDGGRGDQVALIYDSPVTETQRTLHATASCATRSPASPARCAALGVERGDRVVIYMPMVPEAVVAMLACARLGAVHSVVFGGFAAHELAVRIDDARPQVIVLGVLRHRGRSASSRTSRCSTRRSPRRAHAPEHCVILQRPQLAAELTPGRDLDWASRRRRGARADACRCGDRPALHPLHVRARPARPRASCATTAATRSRSRWSMPNVYDVDPGEVVLGRVRRRLGRRPLLHRLRAAADRRTTVLYEGKPVGTPDAGAFWRVVAEHGVNALFTAPTAFRAIKKEDPDGGAARRATTCRRFARCSSPASDSTPRPTSGRATLLGVPVVDHWWQTETGWPIAANCRGLEPMPVKPGSPTMPVPGLPRARSSTPTATSCRAGERGRDRDPAAAAAGRLPTLWNDDERFVGVVPGALPGLLPHRRRRLHRRGRLPLRHGPHRRRHQRRRAPPVDRRDGGGPRARTPTSPSAP